jgi:cytochrome c oxidase cbb3-type subunit 3
MSSTWCRAALVAAALAAAAAGCRPSDQAPAAPQIAPTDKALLAQSLLNASPNEIAADPKMLAYVQSTAQAAIAKHCAECHGADLKGKPGVPNLVDDVWLWGIGPEEQNDVAPVFAIEQTILYGIRNKNCGAGVKLDHYGVCPDTRNSEMPAFEKVGVFTPAEVNDLVEYVVKLSGGEADAAAVARAKHNFTKVCVECHKADGTGYLPYGGANLTDKEWLYGSDRATIRDVIANGRGGVCPPFEHVLDAATIKAVAVYIYRTGQEILQSQ